MINEKLYTRLLQPVFGACSYPKRKGWSAYLLGRNGVTNHRIIRMK